MSVEKARAALGSKDFRGALAAWLGVWRETRATEVAALVDRLSALVAVELTAPSGKTQKALQEAWLSRALTKDAAELAVLLPELFNADRPKLRARLAALAEVDADPRVARALVDRVVVSWLNDYDNPVGTALFKLLAQHGDLASVALLEERWTNSTGEKPERLRRLRIAVNKLPHAPLSDDARDALKAASTALDARQSGTSLIEPGEARLVAADRLLENSDPRGELFTLQRLAKERPLNGVEAAREAALIKTHGQSWMGQLASVADPASARFEDGVLVSLTVIASDVTAVLDAPEWRTVRSVNLQAVKNPAALLSRWPNLRDILVREPEALRAIVESDPPLRSIEALYYRNSLSRQYQGPFDDALVGLLSSERLAGLERLGVLGLGVALDALAGLIGHFQGRLRVLDVHNMVLDTFPEWPAVLSGAPANFQALRVQGGFTLTLTRGADGRFRRLRMALETDPYGRPPGNYVTNLARDCRGWPAGSFEHVELIDTPMLSKNHQKTMAAAIAHLAG
ncbi:MAG: hypothetical protein U0271_27675 [Polyangiaceae bacterium]